MSVILRLSCTTVMQFIIKWSFRRMQALNWDAAYVSWTCEETFVFDCSWVDVSSTTQLLFPNNGFLMLITKATSKLKYIFIKNNNNKSAGYPVYKVLYLHSLITGRATSWQKYSLKLKWQWESSVTTQGQFKGCERWRVCMWKGAALEAALSRIWRVCVTKRVWTADLDKSVWTAHTSPYISGRCDVGVKSSKVKVIQSVNLIQNASFISQRRQTSLPTQTHFNNLLTHIKNILSVIVQMSSLVCTHGRLYSYCTAAV